MPMREASVFAAMYNYERKSRVTSKRSGRSTGARKRTSGLDAGSIGQQGTSGSGSGSYGTGTAQGGKSFHPGQQLHDSRIYNVVKVAWVRNDRDAARHVAAHCNYIEKRERGHTEQERKFFTREKDAVPRSEVIEMIMDHRGAMYFGKAMYKVILSPNTNDLDRQDMTRAVMDRFEKETGSRLHWAAVEHENTLHNHVHIVIAGLRENGRSFSLKPKELEQLRAIGHEYQFEIRHEHLLERDLIAKEMSHFREYAHELTQRDVDRQQGIEIGIYNPKVDERANEILKTNPERDRNEMHAFGLDKYYYNVEKDFKDIKDQMEQVYINEITELAKEHPELFPGLNKDLSNLIYRLENRSENKEDRTPEHEQRDMDKGKDEHQISSSKAVQNLYQYADLTRPCEERSSHHDVEYEASPFPHLHNSVDKDDLSREPDSHDQDSQILYELAGSDAYEHIEAMADDQDFGDFWGEEDSQPVYEEPSESDGPEDDHDERDEEDYF